MQDFNLSPYYDDFNEDKNFHKILFKPGVSVQARELTQLQTIIQDQILKFGNHVFKHGSVVIPGNSGSDLNSPYVKLQMPTQSQIEQFSLLENNEVVGSITGIKAYLRKAVAPSNGDPATLYVTYQGGGNNGESVFADGEQLVVNGTTLTAAETDATGLGSLAFIAKGVYYVYGNFVTVKKQFIPIEKYSQAPSCHVLLKIIEDIVDSDEDETLLDPAQGSYNFAAPGADRQRITLELVSLPLGSTFSDDYFEIMRFNAGTLEEHARYPKYNELEKSLARRTFDESGDYVVNGLDISIKEHRKSGLNNGVYSESAGGDNNKFVAEIAAGKAYIRGFENEKLANTLLSIEKGRTAEHIKTQSNIGFFPAFGQYLYVSGLKNLPSFANRDTIKIYGDLAKTNLLGTAKVFSFDLHSAHPTPELNVYKVFFYDLVLTGSISSARLITDAAGADIALVTHKLNITLSGADFASGDIFSILGSSVGSVVQFFRSSGEVYFLRTGGAFPAPGEKIVSGSKEGIVVSTESEGNFRKNASIVDLPYNATFKLKRQDNTVDTSYSVLKQITVNLVGGVGSGSITGAVLESFDQADPILIHDTLGPLAITSSNVTIATNSISISGLTGVDGPVQVILTAKKTNQTHRNKTLAVFSETKPASAFIQLAKCDVFKITSVIQISTGANVTQAYSLDDGQRDFAYQNGSLSLTGTLPTGNLLISYQYFSHSGNGDYFCTDSYSAAGLGDDYYDQIPNYVSKTDGAVYQLRNCIDFRPRINSVDPADSSYTDLIRIESRMSTSVRYYVPRYDIVIMDKSGVITNISGTPAETPIAPKQPAESILLGTLLIPEYTFNVRNIRTVKAKNQGFTMSEISDIKDRIYKLEQFSLLSATERSLLDANIVDASTGLSRFKSGYLVDSFDNPDSIADTFNPEFSATYVDGALFPKIERNEINMQIVSASNLMISSGGFYTLPYTEAVFAKQDVSSRVTNVNPFAVYSWTGTMELTPSSDNWVETVNLPTVFSTFNTTTVQTVEIVRPWNWNVVPAPAPVPIPAPDPIILPPPPPEPVPPPPPPPAPPIVEPVPVVTFVPEPVPIATASEEIPTDIVLDPINLDFGLDFGGFGGGGLSGMGSGLGGFGGGFGGGGMGGGGGGGGGGSSDGCFLPNTLVDLASGERIEIANVKIGDKVWNRDKSSINVVRFIEVVDNTYDLISPCADLEPFATLNHPIYIDGRLCCAEENSNYSNWLGKMEPLKPAKIKAGSGELVYNLWVTGDHTYRVNGFGTHSILGDGGWMSKAFEQGLLSQAQVLDIVKVCSFSAHRQFGALMVNNAFRNINSQIVNRFIANIMIGKFRKPAFLFLFETLGKIFSKTGN